MKRLRIRPRADRDIDEAFAFIARDNHLAAIRFLEAVEESFLLLQKQSGIGSRRWAHVPLLKHTRMLGVTGFRKHLIFYIEHPTHIEIVRLLHAARDIPAIFGETGD